MLTIQQWQEDWKLKNSDKKTTLILENPFVRTPSKNASHNIRSFLRKKKIRRNSTRISILTSPIDPRGMTKGKNDLPVKTRQDMLRRTIKQLPPKKRSFQFVSKNHQSDKLVNITPFLEKKQLDVASELGVSPSYLAQAWRYAAGGKHWPSKVLLQLNQDIDFYKRCLSSGPCPDLETSLRECIRHRNELLNPIYIAIPNKKQPKCEQD